MTIPVQDKATKLIKEQFENGFLKIRAEYSKVAFVLSQERTNQKEVENVIIDVFKDIYTRGFKDGASTCGDIFTEGLFVGETK